MKNITNKELIDKIRGEVPKFKGASSYYDSPETKEVFRRLEEGEKAKESIEILCYISLGGGIISRGKACELMGVDRADLDTKLGEVQLLIAKRNIDLVDFYQSSKA